jgi:hypothetical protein
MSMDLGIAGSGTGSSDRCHTKPVDKGQEETGNATLVPVEVKEQCGEGHADKGLKGTWGGLPCPFLPRRWQKVGLTKAKSGAKSGLHVARPKDSAGENPTLCRAAKGGATGKQRGGQRGESTSGLEAGERVVISGPAGRSSAAPPLKVVGARGESAGAVLDRDATFMMGTSSKRRAQYPRERLD